MYEKVSSIGFLLGLLGGGGGGGGEKISRFLNSRYTL